MEADRGEEKREKEKGGDLAWLSPILLVLVLANSQFPGFPWGKEKKATYLDKVKGKETILL